MAQNSSLPGDAGQPYDYRRHDQLWQRVAPTLEPYPDTHVSAGSMENRRTAVSGEQTAAEETLPGAQADPCCMGSAALDDIQVLTGFIEAACTSRRYYQTLVRQAPAWARAAFRDMAAEHAAVARRLMAVYYLITGTAYQVSGDSERIWTGPWCPALRERYHIEACAGLNFIRAAEGTTDPCLAKLLTSFSEEAYRRADRILAMLERAV